MSYDLHDTIAAIASAPGGAARGIVRISGPDALDCLAACFVSDDSTDPRRCEFPVRLAGAVHVAGDDQHPPMNVPGHAFVWPGERSYTRQSSAEFHGIGSPPLLAAVLEELCRHGARPAEPGEFTLRAFVAGRIDLTQAEAVLGVVDATSRDDLNGALDQLAGGLSRPLNELREQLLGVLAELEAGLDFADEAIDFIGRDALLERVAAGQRVVASTLAQLGRRARGGALPCVALAGAPNVGKSSLFNALVERFGVVPSIRSLVSSTPGATRDYVVAQLDLDGVACELIDAAGADGGAADAVQQAAQQAAAVQQRRADVRLHCFEAGSPLMLRGAPPVEFGDGDLAVTTKIDLVSRRAGCVSPARLDSIPCSSATRAGLDELAGAIRRRVAQAANDRGGSAAATAARCAGSLQIAARSLAAAAELTGAGRDELLAAEIRTALNAIGEVTGAVCADDVLDRVFSQFCIGK